MMELLKLSKKCRECKYVDTCEHKRMEAIAYIGEESFNVKELASSFANTGSLASGSAIQPHDYRNIKISTDTTVTIDLEEVKKKIAEAMYPNFLQFGA